MSVIEFLSLISKKNIFDKNNEDENAFLMARNNPNVEIIKFLLNLYTEPNKNLDFNFNIRLKNKNNENAFLLACQYNSNLDVVKLFNENPVLRNLISVDSINKYNDSAFIVACQNSNNLEIIKYLIDNLFMDINRENMGGNTGFFMAARYNPNLEIVKYLAKDIQLMNYNIQIHMEIILFYLLVMEIQI